MLSELPNLKKNPYIPKKTKGGLSETFNENSMFGLSTAAKTSITSRYDNTPKSKSTLSTTF